MYYIYRYTYDTIVKNVSKYIIALSEYSQVQFTGLIPPLPGVLGHRTFLAILDKNADIFYFKALRFILTSFQV